MIAGLFGFFGIAASAAVFARIIFYIFLAGALISLIAGLMRK